MEPIWELLCNGISRGKCTPFLGAGACDPWLPLGAEIARVLAKEYDYPFEDPDDLQRVTQFIAVKFDPIFIKEKLLARWFSSIAYPDWSKNDEPHTVLADLPLPIYITTNYDEAMVRALRAKGKEAHREVCRWSDFLEGEASIFYDRKYEPDSAAPVVFHLHGHNDLPESLVLTEDDYVDFLVRLVDYSDILLPLRIQEALVDSVLVFIGYSLNDINFRVLLRRIAPLRRFSAILVQPPTDRPDRASYVVNHLSEDMNISVFWGKADEFAAGLYKHWREFSNGNRG